MIEYWLNFDAQTSKSQRATMSLIGIPEEIIEAYVLPKLGWNDLLRFRKTNKHLYRITTGYMRVHPEVAPEIEINEKEKNLAAFMKMYIPTTKIYLKNESGEKFYRKNVESIAGFLQKCGHLVKKLRVQKFSMYLYGREWEFVDALKNLESFEAGYLDMGPLSKGPFERRKWSQNQYKRAKKDTRFANGIYPEGLQKLKSLTIGQEPYEDMRTLNILDRTPEYLKSLIKLEFVSLPFNPYINEKFEQDLGRDVLKAEKSLALAFVFVQGRIDTRKEMYPREPNLRAVDFRCYHDNWNPEIRGLIENGSGDFLSLCKCCVENDVKLFNVGSSWYSGQAFFPEVACAELGKPVMSMVNLHPSVFSLQMPNLERLEIQATSKCHVPHEWNWEQVRPEWPALKSLDMTVDTYNHDVLEYDEDGDVEDSNPFWTGDVFNFLFQGAHRLALTELRLNFEDQTCPSLDDIVSSCPHLKKLTIAHWPGTNKSLLKLWEGCQGLEEINFENCPYLGNVAFVGLDTENPVFLKLKNLKKLSLIGLDQMPKITDLLFSMVICYLGLTHLIITSDKPVSKVTFAGIKALLEGKFAESIAKFPFVNWSLAGTSVEEFKKLETMFRSYEMI